MRMTPAASSTRPTTARSRTARAVRAAGRLAAGLVAAGLLAAGLLAGCTGLTFEFANTSTAWKAGRHATNPYDPLSPTNAWTAY